MRPGPRADKEDVISTRTRAPRRPRQGIDAFTSSESIVPWIGATVVVGATAALGWTTDGADLLAYRVLPTVAFAAIFFCTIVISGRQRARRNEAVALTSDRLQTDELAGASNPGDLLAPARSDGPAPAVAPYLTGMASYTGAAAELLDHAISVAGDEPADPALVTLRDDTRDLHELLVALCEDPPSLEEVARIHTLGALWESGFREHERRAASVDLDYFERWRARTVAIRRLRHGVTAAATAASTADLPYRV
jgi:hypothetical protein